MTYTGQISLTDCMYMYILFYSQAFDGIIKFEYLKYLKTN